MRKGGFSHLCLLYAHIHLDWHKPTETLKIVSPYQVLMPLCWLPWWEAKYFWLIRLSVGCHVLAISQEWLEGFLQILAPLLGLKDALVKSVVKGQGHRDNKMRGKTPFWPLSNAVTCSQNRTELVTFAHLETVLIVKIISAVWCIIPDAYSISMYNKRIYGYKHCNPPYVHWFHWSWA